MLNKLKEGRNVKEHLNQFFDAKDKLKDIDITVHKDVLSILLLYSLPESFENFRCVIESRDELPNPEMFKVKIIEKSESRTAKESESTQNALHVHKRKFFNKYENAKVNQKREIYKNSERKPQHSQIQCHKCRKFGHSRQQCISKETHQLNKTGKTESYIVIENIEQTTLNIDSSKNMKKEWCLDSECTAHMSSNKNDSNKLSKLSKSLNLTTNNKTKVDRIGEITLSVDRRKYETQLNLKNTLFVPELRTNLMSVSKITDRNYEVLFTKSNAYTLNENHEITMIADRIGDLYYIRKNTEAAAHY